MWRSSKCCESRAWSSLPVRATFCIVATSFFLLPEVEQILVSGSEISPWNMGDGFRHIYLDLGTNIGVQIRKLFEPKLYPKAGIHKFFNEWFEVAEERNRTVCAIGFEPDPSHTHRLEEVESWYRSGGYCVRIFTQTAIGTQDGPVQLYQDKDVKHERWGSSIVLARNRDHSVRSITTVNSVNASRLVEKLSHRCCWDNAIHYQKKPAIIVKMDIEGAEYDVISQMIETGMICHIHLLFIEWHKEKGFKTQVSARRMEDKLHYAAKQCPHPPIISKFDDESYLNDGRPLHL